MSSYHRIDVYRIAALSAIYFLTAKLGLALAPLHGTVTLFWAPSGIALATLLMFGWRVFPAIAIGEFFANLGTGLPLASVAGISVGNTAEGLLGYYLLRQCFGFSGKLTTLREVGLLFVFGALLSPLVAAANGAWWVMYATGGSWADYLNTMRYWWMGDALGVALFAPAILTWGHGEAERWTRERVRLAVLTATILLMVCVQVFSRLEHSYLWVDLFFPILIWIAINFRLRHVSLALLLVFASSVLGLLALGDLHTAARAYLVEYVWLHNLLFGLTALSVAALNSQRDSVENELRLSEDNLNRAQAVGGVGSWHLDLLKNHLIWSAESCRIFGVAGSDSLSYQDFLARVHPDDLALLDSAWKEALSGKPYDIEYRIVVNGEQRWVRVRAEFSFDGKQRATDATGTIQDITEWKSTGQRIQQLAYCDALTGLPNRALLYDRLHQTVAAAHRDQGQFALMFIDLDRFKYINDTMGHQAGDEMLKVVAQRLTAAVREVDTVSRLGGDEFVVLLRDTGAEGALFVAEKTLHLIAHSFEVNGVTVNTEASIGISLYPHDGKDVETLIKHADVAMYHAKEAGRNNFQFYTEQINERAMSHFNIERDLRLALERHELIVYYQPQIRMSDKKLIGLEALLRWQHPAKGMVSPASFIPVAEECGLIVPIGEWVLGEVCRQARTWHTQGMTLVPIAVNLSARQLQGDRLAKFMRALLIETDLPDWTLELELTESMMLNDEKGAKLFIDEMRSLGVALSIDDFGTGYSSLGHLKKLSLDKLKIDQSFVRDIAADEDDAAIVRAIISMAHGLGLTVIAEGVETPEQLEFLNRLGCNEVQGYFFARPMPAAEVEAFVARLNG